MFGGYSSSMAIDSRKLKCSCNDNPFKIPKKSNSNVSELTEEQTGVWTEFDDYEVFGFKT